MRKYTKTMTIGKGAYGYVSKAKDELGNEIYAMISNMETAPQKILVNGEELSEDTNSLQKNTGWHYSSESQRLFLNIPNPKGKVILTIINS